MGVSVLRGQGVGLPTVKVSFWPGVRMEKPERKLVLRIMDTQNLMAEERSMDSFLCGFHLALEMANELNCYKQDRQSLPAEEDETDAGSDDYNRKQ